jgi:hypothetical protein
MNPALILTIINAVTQLTKAVAPLIAEAPSIFGSKDADEIKKAADDLFDATTAMHDRVQTKLRGSGS